MALTRELPFIPVSHCSLEKAKAASNVLQTQPSELVPTSSSNQLRAALLDMTVASYSSTLISLAKDLAFD